MTTAGTPPHTTRGTCGATTLLPRGRCSRGSSRRSFPKEHRHERDRHRDDGRTGRHGTGRGRSRIYTDPAIFEREAGDGVDLRARVAVPVPRIPDPPAG